MGDKVCGTGAQCEQTCPVMKMGRICPPLEQFLEEVRDQLNCDAEAASLDSALV